MHEGQHTFLSRERLQKPWPHVKVRAVTRGHFSPSGLGRAWLQPLCTNRGSSISLRASFDPIFDFSPRPGLIKGTNVAHFSREYHQAAAVSTGTELERSLRASQEKISPDIGPWQGDRRRKDRRQVSVNRRGVTHCCCDPGLLPFQSRSFRLHPAVTLTHTDFYTIYDRIFSLTHLSSSI